MHTASSAFYEGVSVEQILMACHWCSYNTFTSFYMNEVAWQTDIQFSFGPYVVDQQVVLAPLSCLLESPKDSRTLFLRPLDRALNFGHMLSGSSPPHAARSEASSHD